MAERGGKPGAGGGLGFWLQVLALLLSVVVITISLLYSGRQVELLREETRRFTRSYAELISAVATDTSSYSTGLDAAVSQLIARFDFPYIVTDSTDVPHSWRGIGEEGDTPESLDRIVSQVRIFDRQFDPIPLDLPGAEQVFHYGDPPAVRRLRLLPWIQLGLLALVLMLIWWSLAANLAKQRGQVWVGLARETAHQFGTPLSSLQGWIRLLGEKLSPPSPEAAAGEQGSEGPDPRMIVAAMEEDVTMLTRVTNRFGKIGSPAASEPVDLEALTRRVTGYMRERAPQRGAVVEFREEYGANPGVSGQEELLEWVVENLLKNAMDAVGSEPGVITITTGVSPDGGTALVRIEDSGSGIESSDQRHIFEPGFSRKKRGWGLGLALSRRLVESYGGRLRLIRSHPGSGSLFEVAMPTSKEKSRS
ncbi:sensor histidine kinase [Gemmatimonadota bacterium]